MDSWKLFTLLCFVISLFRTSAQLGLGETCKPDNDECIVQFDTEHKTVWCHDHHRQCTCRDGYVTEDERCVIGGLCSNQSDCSGFANSVCNIQAGTNICACKSGFTLSTKKTACLALIGNACTNLNDCAGSGSIDVICRDGACTCSDNTVPTGDDRQCITKAAYGGVCTEQIQCSFSDFAECVYRKCQCRAEYTFNGETCTGELGLGSVCERDVQCSVEGDLKKETVWCHNKQCSCKKGYKRDNNRCIIGGDCTSDNDCDGLENSWCDIRPRDRHSCSCNIGSGFVPGLNNTKCLQVVKELGAGCSDTRQCSEHLGDAYCSESKQCVCVKGATVNKDKTKCSKNGAISTVLSISCLALVSLVKLL